MGIGKANLVPPPPPKPQILQLFFKSHGGGEHQGRGTFLSQPTNWSLTANPREDGSVGLLPKWLWMRLCKSGCTLHRGDAILEEPASCGSHLPAKTRRLKADTASKPDLECGHRRP